MEEPIKEETKKEVDVAALVAKVEALEQKDAENQEKLKLLYEVADKGRVLNYEGQRVGVGKKPMKVKLSVYNDGVIIGWRTIKDILVKHPTTGLTVGEEQQYELLVLDKEGKVNKAMIDGYPQFSAARYNERIEVEVVGKREDNMGVMTFDLLLPDGRQVSLNSRFVN